MMLPVHRLRMLYYGMLFVTAAIHCFMCDGSEKRQLKILMVVPEFPKIHDVCMLNQFTGLIDRGHLVTIYAPLRGDLKHVQQDVITYDLLSHTIIGEFPADVNAFDIIVFQLGHKAFDVKQTHNFKGKVVVCLRGYDVTAFLQSNPHAYDNLFISCDLFMPVCDVFKNILEKAGCDLAKIVVHHSGIDCSYFDFIRKNILINQPIMIVSAGRFIEKKGFEYAIKAIAQLVKKYPSIHYRLIGEGILKKSYKKLIKHLGVSKNIILDGWHTHDEYNKILNGAHIFLMPSVTGQNNDQEGIPNVIKEAMAKGVVVVATRHSGISEIVMHNVSGFLVPERSSYALSFMIDSILQHFDTMSEVTIRARSIVEKEFDNERLNNRLEEIFLQLVDQ